MGVLHPGQLGGLSLWLYHPPEAQRFPEPIFQHRFLRDLTVEDEDHVLLSLADGQLRRLQLSTGAQSVVGTILVPGDLSEIVTGPNGTIFAGSSFPQTGPGLVSFDPLSGVTTPVLRDLAWFWEIATIREGRVFALDYSGLLEIDTASGEAMPFDVGTIADFAIVPAPEPGREVMGVVALLSIATAYERGRRRRA